MVFAAEHADIGGEDAARDGAEPAGHEHHDLRARHPRDVGTDGQGGLCLTDEDIGGGGDRLGSGDAQGPLQDPREPCDGDLHDAKVVEDAHERSEEDDDREDPDDEDETPGAGGIGGLAEEELGAGIGEGDDAGDAGSEAVEDEDQRRVGDAEEGQEKLEGQTGENDAGTDGCAVGGEDERQPEDEADAEESLWVHGA